jgi:hypothetical protein
MKGGFTIVPNLFFDAVNAAIVKFQQEVTDKKAMILPTFNTVRDLVRVSVYNDRHWCALPYAQSVSGSLLPRC